MTKKEYREMMYSQEATILSNIEIIEFDIFLALQLETRNSIIIDTANNQPLLYNNKFITYPKSDMNDKDIIGFDPFNNNRLMQFLFSLYMRNYQRDVEPVQSFFISNLDQNGKGTVTCRVLRGDIISDYFSNESLRYINLILKMESNAMQYNMDIIDNYINFIKEEKALERAELAKTQRPPRKINEQSKRRSPFMKIIR